MSHHSSLQSEESFPTRETTMAPSHLGEIAAATWMDNMSTLFYLFFFFFCPLKISSSSSSFGSTCEFAISHKKCNSWTQLSSRIVPLGWEMFGGFPSSQLGRLFIEIGAEISFWYYNKHIYIYIVTVCRVFERTSWMTMVDCFCIRITNEKVGEFFFQITKKDVSPSFSGLITDRVRCDVRPTLTGYYLWIDASKHNWELNG